MISYDRDIHVSCLPQYVHCRDLQDFCVGFQGYTYEAIDHSNGEGVALRADVAYDRFFAHDDVGCGRGC